MYLEVTFWKDSLYTFSTFSMITFLRGERWRRWGVYGTNREPVARASAYDAEERTCNEYANIYIMPLGIT